MTEPALTPEPVNDFASTVLVITREGMGHAEPALQLKLLRTFLTLLLESAQSPRAICFYTEGVRLVVEGSPLLDLLQSLESRGVPLIVCQTCLNHFQIAEKRRVGLVGGMGDIIAAMATAGKVITLSSVRSEVDRRFLADSPAPKLSRELGEVVATSGNKKITAGIR